jgi:hypothetical protein
MKHYKCMSHKIDLETLTKKDIISFSQQHQMELSFKNKANGYAQNTFKDLAKTFEVVIEQLEHCCGVAGVPLAYVPRKNIIPRGKYDDPPENHPSLDAKAIARALILKDGIAFPGQSVTAIALLEQNGPFCNTFCINMVMVWNILYKIYEQTPAWFHAAPTKKEKNCCKVVSSPVCPLSWQ